MQDVEDILRDAAATLTRIEDADELEQVKARYLGRQGSVTELLKGLGKLPAEEKRTRGAEINRAKVQIEKLHGKNLPPAETLRLCRAYAAEQIERQKKDFVRLGVLGDWDNPYMTMAFRNEADEIRTLGALLDEAARAIRLSLRRGVYLAVSGPSYETPAEIRAGK